MTLPKSERVRAFTNKTRTGCLTCKYVDVPLSRSVLITAL